MTAASVALEQLHIAPRQLQSLSKPTPGYEPDTNDEIINVDSVFGIEIYSHSDQQNADYGIQSTSLTSGSVKSWLEQELLPEGTQLVAKLLIAKQSLVNDFLKPPAVYPTVDIPRELLARSLGIPSRGIARLGSLLAWAMPFTVDQTENNSCYGINASNIMAVWSYDTAIGINRALIVVRNLGHLMEEVLELVQRLKNASHLPALVPFIVTETISFPNQVSLHTFEDGSRDNMLHITRHLQQIDAQSAFCNTSTRVDQVLYVRESSKAAMEMAQHEITSSLGSRVNMSSSEYDSLVKDHRSLLNMVLQRAEELRIVVENCDTLIRKTQIQVSSILGLMASKQQAISVQIAKDTRRDGASMKTMALMAMLYLPSTAVSAVLAIPVFRWDAKSASNIATNKVWIFFVVAIPLTIITLLSFRYWLYVEEQSELKANPERRNVMIKKSSGTKKRVLSFFSKPFWAKLNFSKMRLPKHVKKEVV